METSVLIVGAGPTGLMLAGWLARLGVRALVVDRKPGVVEETRALGVQARTLEVYDQLGLVPEGGQVATGVNFWVRGQHVARGAFGEMGKGLSPHPYMFILGQDRNEALLLEHLRAHGGEVQWNTELVSFRQDSQGVTAQLRGPAGDQEVRALYVCGCDGGQSTVRHGLGIDFPGGTYAHRFFVADTRSRGAIRVGEVNLSLDDERFSAFFPMPGENRFRIVGMLPAGQQVSAFEEVRADIERRFRVKVEEVFWFSSYLVHHRVAPRFREHRAFLLGDAAHVHSPAGAQGMNTGLMDATNLAWKLAAVLGGAPERLLDTYAAERQPFARRLVSTTDRAFGLITTSRWRWVLPFFFRLALRFGPVRRAVFGILSQTRLEYRSSPLSRTYGGGSVRGGDRLPWVADVDNFKPLTSLQWQVHVYGGVYPAGWARTPVHHFPYSADARRAGLKEGTLYLVRPDGYVGMASTGPAPLVDYLLQFS